MSIVHLETKAQLTERLESENSVLVDFYAEWCGPCKMLAPVLEEISSENEGKVEIVKIDIDKAEELAQEYRVMAVPTLLYFKNGEVAAKSVGLQSKTAILKQLEKL